MVFMLLPLMLQSFPAQHPGTRDQWAIVLLASLGLLIADFLSYRLRLGQNWKAKTEITKLERSAKALIISFSFLILSASVIHISLMPEVPFLKWLNSAPEARSAMIDKSRELATKSLPVPHWVSYVFTWSLSVLAPIAIVLAWKMRWYFFALGLLLYTTAYALATAAKLPVLSLIFSVTVACALLDRTAARLLKLVGLSFLAGIFILSLWSISRLNKPDLENPPVSTLNVLTDEDPRSTSTLADQYRMKRYISIEHDDPLIERFQRLADYIVYRIVLVPSDVAIRWYQYYTHSQQPIGWTTVVTASGSVSAPSRAVGTWAYANKFPDQYRSYVNAYASFDADGYARDGARGALLVILLLVVTRLALAFLRSNTPITIAAYGTGLAMLSYLPMQASLQATIVANGLFLVLCILSFVKYGNRQNNQ